jgi:hypothetical protein
MTEPSEHDEQVAVINWADAMSYKYPELSLLYAVPNAAKRSPKLAAYMKAEGLKAGVPDLCLPVARKGYNGLYIEMKKKGGRNPMPVQDRWLTALANEGYMAVCCKGRDAAICVLMDYMEDR